MLSKPSLTAFLMIVVICVLIGFGSLTSDLAASEETKDKIRTYINSKPLVDLSINQLNKKYQNELKELEFIDSQETLNPILLAIGKNVETFWLDFPNTVSKEAIRLSWLDLIQSARDILVREAHDRINQESYYMIMKSKTDAYKFSEDRTNENGKPIKLPSQQYVVSAGFAGACAFFSPQMQSDFRYRYLGRQKDGVKAHVIAFAQKKESTSLGNFQIGEISASLVYHGLAWIDPETNQILRMRMEVQQFLAPTRVYVDVQTDIRYEPVQFEAISRSFLLPHEVAVTIKCNGMEYNNLHRYSDYKVFTTESQIQSIKPVETKLK